MSFRHIDYTGAPTNVHDFRLQTRQRQGGGLSLTKNCVRPTASPTIKPREVRSPTASPRQAAATTTVTHGMSLVHESAL